MKSTRLLRRSPACGLAALAVCGLVAALAGCRANALGKEISPTHATSVDATWVTATRNCWPSLNKATDKVIAAALLEPKAFRGAFPGFAELPDSQIASVVADNVKSAPPAALNVFQNASEPVLSRTQALQPHLSLDRNSAAAHFAPNLPDDALCAIHNGTPVGFK